VKSPLRGQQSAGLWADSPNTNLQFDLEAPSRSSISMSGSALRPNTSVIQPLDPRLYQYTVGFAGSMRSLLRSSRAPQLGTLKPMSYMCAKN
jgi:hypothetical protein